MCYACSLSFFIFLFFSLPSSLPVLGNISIAPIKMIVDYSVFTLRNITKNFGIFRRVIALHTTMTIYVRLIKTLSYLWIVVYCYVHYSKFDTIFSLENFRENICVSGVRYLFLWSSWETEPSSGKLLYETTWVLWPLFRLLKLSFKRSKTQFAWNFGQ